MLRFQLGTQPKSMATHRAMVYFTSGASTTCPTAAQVSTNHFCTIAGNSTLVLDPLGTIEYIIFPVNLFLDL